MTEIKPGAIVPASKSTLLPPIRVELTPSRFLGRTKRFFQSKTNLTIGYACEFRSRDKNEDAAGLSFDPIKLPRTPQREVSVCVELLDHPHCDEPAECILTFLWLGGDGRTTGMNSGPIQVSKSTDWKAQIPISSGQGDVKRNLDPSIALSCALLVTLMQPGQKVLVRSVSIEVI